MLNRDLDVVVFDASVKGAHSISWTFVAEVIPTVDLVRLTITVTNQGERNPSLKTFEYAHSEDIAAFFRTLSQTIDVLQSIYAKEYIKALGDLIPPTYDCITSRPDGFMVHYVPERKVAVFATNDTSLFDTRSDHTETLPLTILGHYIENSIRFPYGGRPHLDWETVTLRYAIRLKENVAPIQNEISRNM